MTITAEEAVKSNHHFSKWRQRLWPVNSCELYKLIPLLLLKFCVSFNYTILHATKDTLTVTTKGSGAEAIPILKGWIVLIMAFIAMLIYSKLSNRLSKSGLFYATMAPFIVFFALYGFFLYPNREWLCPHASSDWLLNIVGKQHEHWISVYKYWMNSLFFVMSELWGGMVIALLFWGFANQVSTIDEAARFYTLFSLGGHLGTITAGRLIWHTSQLYDKGHYDQTLQWMMALVLVVCFVMLFIYWWLNHWIATHSSVDNIVAWKRKKEERTKLTLKESLSYIVHSPYLGFIALMVIGYSLSVNMVEVSWKAALKLRYPEANDYQAVMGMISSAVGTLSFFLALFIGGNVMRKFGWHLSAQLTPLVLGVFSMAFFVFYFMYVYMGAGSSLFGIDTLMLVVICGAFHNIACKSMKYCLFDPTKEMAYIPLDAEGKVKGKAAVDVVASRFGKSGSSWIQAGLIELMGTGSILSIAPCLLPLVAIAVCGWMAAVYGLNKRFFVLQKTSNSAQAVLAN